MTDGKKGVELPGRMGRWVEVSRLSEPWQYTAEIAIYCRLPEPTPMPFLLPGMFVRACLRSFVVTSSDWNGEKAFFGAVDIDSEEYCKLAYEEIVEVRDRGQVVWGRA